MTGDTIRSMRLCALVVLLAACSSDPTLAVTVVHPVGLSVATSSVSVYESSTLHCEDIEFARLDPAGLEAVLTSEADLDATGSSGTLTGISRIGNKVIVARGFDTNQMLVSAGCAEKGEVRGDDSVTVTTLIAAIVSVRPPSDLLPNDTVVTLTDAGGRALPDQRPITWTVYGPAGSTAANPSNITEVSNGTWEPKLPSCADQTAFKIHPNPPSILGGYAVQVRVAWAADQPPAYTSLASTAFKPIAGIATLATTARRACAIRIAGTARSLVCVDTNDMAHEYSITVTNGQAAALAKGSPVTALPALAGTQHAIALVSVAGAGTDRDVYSVTDRGAIVPLYAAPAITSTPQCVGTPCTDAMFVPACGGIAAKLLIGSALGTVHQIDTRGGNTSSFDLPGLLEARLDNAGCVTSLQQTGAPALGQLASVHAGNSPFAETTLINCSTGTCTPVAIELTRGASVGFTGGSEPRIVFTTVDATGVVLVSEVFSPGTLPIERARMPAAAIPDHLIAGQLDTDMDPDLFWDIGARNGTANFEIAYARQVGNTNLEALSAPASVDVDDLELGDLDGDGLEEIVAVLSTGVAIVPIGVAIPAPTPNADATCMP